LIPQTNTLNCGINYNYKRPVKELFWSCSAYFNRSWDNSIVNMSIDNGKYSYKVETFSHTTNYFQQTVNFLKDSLIYILRHVLIWRTVILKARRFR